MAPGPHQGGRLEDMAAEGTSIPNDAGKQNLIPSVPRPDQINPDPSLAHANPAHGADNAYDIPRSVNDRGQTGEILTGTGDSISSNVEKKNLDDANFDPRAKGHDQYAKHARQDNPYESLKHGSASHDVDAAPGEEELGQDELLSKRGAK
ncbi:Nn.00g115120.m01.CDS01 [Neocucurbitaria sp. VM-36]